MNGSSEIPTTQNTEAPESPQAAAEINPEKLEALMRELRLNQNLPFAIAAGLVSSIVGAVIWAAITVVSGYQIGWMAVGVGVLVGFAVRFMGKGISTPFGLVGAISALFGCLLGNVLSTAAFISKYSEVAFFDVLGKLNFALVQGLMNPFSPIDMLFYGIAIYQGYKLSFHRISEQDIHQLTD